MPDTTEEQTDRVFKALAAHSRRRILAVLALGPGHGACCSGEEFCACDLAVPTGLSASTISHHMKVLVEARLVSAEKRGLWVFYRLRPETFVEAITQLEAFVADAELERRVGS